MMDNDQAPASDVFHLEYILPDLIVRPEDAWWLTTAIVATPAAACSPPTFIAAPCFA